MAPRPAHSFVQSGLPLIVLTVGGWLGLSYFMKARYDGQEAQAQAVDLHAPVERQRAKRFDLEGELARLRGSTSEAEYSNKPIPRPREME